MVVAMAGYGGPALAVKTGGKIKFPSGRVISVNDGGLGLVEMLFPTAENKGIEIIYEARATGLILDKKGEVTGVRVQTREGLVDFKSRAVVLAAGGFEANLAVGCRRQQKSIVGQNLFDRIDVGGMIRDYQDPAAGNGPPVVSAVSLVCPSSRATSPPLPWVADTTRADVLLDSTSAPAGGSRPDA